MLLPHILKLYLSSVFYGFTDLNSRFIGFQRKLTFYMERVSIQISRQLYLNDILVISSNCRFPRYQG
jgi:hypothetical protein